MARHNVWECYHDYMQELAAELERAAHEENRCEGIPRCGYCLDDQQQAEKEENQTHGK